MKRSFTLMPVLVGLIIFLHSCTASSDTVTQLKTNIKNSKESATVCFVQMTDGTIKNYTTLKLVTGIATRPHLLADGKTKIYADEINAYQNETHYAISQKNLFCGHVSNIAVETLPGFAIRIQKGKLNVYSKKYSYNGRTVDEFFLQSGNDGQIIAYTPEYMNKLVKDHADAYNFFNSKRYKNTLKMIQSTVSLYNNTDESISKN